MKKDVLVAVSVFNESELLPEWLDHWLPLTSDLVVFDQSSTDSTPDILEKYRSEHPDDMQVFHVPHLGMTEPLYNAAQRFSTTNNKWLIRVDIDEFIDEEMWGPMWDEAERVRKDLHTPALFIARKNYINDRDASALFASPSDPKGNDWQIRILYGQCANFSPAMHTHPQIPGRFAYLDPDKYYLTHIRSFERIVKANLGRMAFANDQAKQIQGLFVQKVGQFLGMTQEQFTEVVKKYE